MVMENIMETETSVSAVPVWEQLINKYGNKAKIKNKKMQ